MATLLLSAAGAAIGAGFGGTVLGLSGAVIGRAIGATLGRVIDQRLIGAGSDAVEVGRVDRLRLTGAGEGAAIGRVWGRSRVAGQVIWATEFQENRRKSGGGKGAPQPKTVEFSYSISLAIALCEGEIVRVGRVWADGTEIRRKSLGMRVYTGSADQLPDAKIEAVEGAGSAPAFRGTAYVVIEDLDLTPFGNRVPQFTFEVVRRAKTSLGDPKDLADAVRSVALIPGTGEYALATTPVHYKFGRGKNRSANVHTESGKTDFATSLDQLVEELPQLTSVSLVVSWFGSDLRCGTCEVQPKVEQKDHDGVGQPWRAGGIGRSNAEEIPRVGGNSVYGGTPGDASVREAIGALRAAGKEVMFYPFILMDQVDGNTLPDPYSDATGQPALPWRGRITLSEAPGRAGSPDATAAAAAEVATFFGAAQASDFTMSGGNIVYSGPAHWGYRRFILHYAKLCAHAGGVDAFCIGSEMRGLTQIRGASHSFPAVQALRQLAADVRGILGPTTKITYAADWSEYFGYHTGDNVYFHLDPLWADANIDFVGIDNYLPVADWRDGEAHRDAGFGAIHDLGYLESNIAGGEGYDWFYDSPEGERAQVRRPIVDTAHGEDWVFRPKDLQSWWSEVHHDRIAGVRQTAPTAWVPKTKPIRFTEYGCAAIDKGANTPNRFIDPKSSESGLPRGSSGRRDDLMQMQYFRAFRRHYANAQRNPVSPIYGGTMVDMERAHAWAWDARPFPAFPAQSDVWSDAENYQRGHWLNGRISNQSLEAVASELIEASGVGAFDGARGYGVVRGYVQNEVTTARAALQPLSLGYGFDVLEREGVLSLRMRNGEADVVITDDDLVFDDELTGSLEAARAPEAETAGHVRLAYVEAEGAYEIRQAEAIFPDEIGRGVAQSDTALVLTGGEAQATVERWLTEARVARDSARLTLPKSRADLGAGDVLVYKNARYRIDRVEIAEAQRLDVVRIEPGTYVAANAEAVGATPRQFSAPVPVDPVFLDLPLLRGTEVPHQPHIAVGADPWPGSVAVWASIDGTEFEVNTVLAAPAILGVTENEMWAAQAGLFDRGPALRVRIAGGALSSASVDAVMNGANVMAIGDGSAPLWEVFQFVDATLVAPDTYDLSLRLRGQAGSDGVMPDIWPAGSTVVVLDRSLQQIDLALSARGLSRTYRIGVAGRGFADPTVEERVETFDSVGLRPYAVAHLRQNRPDSGDIELSWVRRTRIDGDSWQSVEVPLGETAESYRVRVFQGAALLREVTATSPSWTYTSADQSLDGATVPFRIEVAQQSDQFGAGPGRSLTVSA